MRRPLLYLCLAALASPSWGCGPASEEISTDTPDPARLLLSVSELAYGTVAIGDEASLTVSMANTGEGTITLSDVHVEPPELGAVFPLVDPSPRGLAPGEILAVDVSFRPARLGNYVAALAIESDDGDGGRAEVDLTGVGGPSEDADQDADGFSPSQGDCDDGDRNANPDAAERCGDGLDNNCNGEIDDLDQDGDGAVAPECGGDDCEDTNGAVYPNAPEQCDGLSSSCVDVSEAEAEVDFYPDQDSDGYGDSSGAPVRARRCDPPAGYTEATGDCDDADPQSNPGERERCDGADLDNDCDPSTQDNIDTDADGFTLCQGDCDDTDLLRAPTVVQAGSVATPDGSYAAPWPSIGLGVSNDRGCRLILIQAGTYVENLSISEGSYSLVGVDGAGATTLEGLGDGPVVRLVAPDSRTTLAVLLEGMTIRGGLATEGGGIYAERALLTLREVELIDNETIADGSGTGGVGGGLYLGEDTLIQMEGGSLAFNRAQVAGGAAYLLKTPNVNSRPLLTLLGVRVESNLAARGGGIFADEESLLSFEAARFSGNEASEGQGGAVLMGRRARLTDRRSTYDGNSAAYGGGALALAQGADVDVSGGVLLSNVAGFGGAVLNVGGTLTLTQSWLEGNRAGAPSSEAATGSGGALYIDSAGRTTLSNVVMLANQADGGGALYATAGAGRLSLVNSTLAYNQSGPTLGTVTLRSPDMSDWDVHNVIVAYDQGSYEWVVQTDSSQTPLLNVLEYTNLWALEGEGARAWAGPAEVDPYAEGSTNLAAAPGFVGALSDEALQTDLHLGEGSPLIDAGDPDPLYSDADGSRADLGAFGGPAGGWSPTPL